MRGTAWSVRWRDLLSAIRELDVTRSRHVVRDVSTSSADDFTYVNRARCAGDCSASDQFSLVFLTFCQILWGNTRMSNYGASHLPLRGMFKLPCEIIRLQRPIYYMYSDQRSRLLSMDSHDVMVMISSTLSLRLIWVYVCIRVIVRGYPPVLFTRRLVFFGGVRPV